MCTGTVVTGIGSVSMMEVQPCLVLSQIVNLVFLLNASGRYLEDANDVSLL